MRARVRVRVGARVRVGVRPRVGVRLGVRMRARVRVRGGHRTQPRRTVAQALRLLAQSVEQHLDRHRLQ